MKGVENTFSFLLVFLVLFSPAFSINTLSSTESLTISSNRTLVSPGGVFELGFFKPSPLSRWYLGLWYKKVSEKSYVWVANRDNPLSSSIGTLRISGYNLVLLDQSNNSVWSTKLTRGKARPSPVVAELLPNGNFVLRYSNNNQNPRGFIWQSFDFPTDTLLPEMKLGYDLKTGRNRFLTSWRSSNDPSSGDSTYKLDTTRGLPEFIFMYEGLEVQRSGPWNGVEFSGIPDVQGLNYMVSKFTENSEEIAYTFLITNQSIYSRWTISHLTFGRFTWTPPSRGWSYLRALPTDECDLYSICGPNSYCDLTTSPNCNCIRGFVPKNQTEWDNRDGSDGCVRRTHLSCRGDGFLRLENVKLPDTKMAIVDTRTDLKGCEKRCLGDCTCTSYAAADVRNGGFGCVIWTGWLVDIRTYSNGGQDFYVKVAAAELGFSSDEKRNRNGKIIGWSTGVSLMLILSVIVFCFWKRGQNQAKSAATPVFQVGNQVLMNGVVLPRKRTISGENEVEDLELPLLEFEAVVTATEHFSDSNKVGAGGFGVVYKGRLLDGQEIAVKRLSEKSDQGTNEFMNEVRLIARLQHINLVRLLGCCVDKGERILIYEYLENLSLDSHLFDKTRSCMLNWQMRFDIINGIARGLLYLHQDSSIRIIHRDLKASNILLDKYMTPKISDFGMARIFGRDETEANTRKVVGTYGYISPEYALEGIFSMKSDVYSFGVLLLETISGKRNKGFHNCGRDHNLLEWVWRNWTEGQGLEIVDTVIADSSSPTFRPREILRCLQIGLLCVQARVDDRPLMSAVVLMLGSDAADIPQPQPPGYCVIGNSLEIYSTRSKQPDHESCTVNQITMSIVDAR